MQMVLQWRRFQSFQKPDERYKQGALEKFLTTTPIW